MITKYVIRRQRKELRRNKRKKFTIRFISVLLMLLFSVMIFQLIGLKKEHLNKTGMANGKIITEELPGYSGLAYVEVNGNVPYFT